MVIKRERLNSLYKQTYDLMMSYTDIETIAMAEKFEKVLNLIGNAIDNKEVND